MKNAKTTQGFTNSWTFWRDMAKNHPKACEMLQMIEKWH